MSEQIDWSRAPTDAMVLLKHVRDGAYAVAESYGDEAKTWHWPDPRHSFPLMPEMWRVVAERPSTPSWSGEGLPPVGVHVEWYSDVYGWLGGKVIGHDGTVAVVSHNDGYTGCNLHNLKPIRTQEQIAADERESAIKRACADIDKLVAAYNMSIDCSAAIRATIEALHDAGYRKP